MSSLQPGQSYKLSLLFHEQCCSRGFDISANGEQIVDEYSPQRDQGGTSGGGRPGAFVNYDFTASSATLELTLQGS